MNIFVVCHASNPERLGSSIQNLFRDNHYALGNGQWLVAASKKTAQGISEDLGLSNGNLAIVATVANYWGHAEPNIWEWIKVKVEASGV